MNLQELLQITVFLLLVFLPSVIMGLLVRLAPIYQLSQSNSFRRSAIVLGNGLLCWGITFTLLIWLASAILYGIAEFYFDTSLGQVPGITRANVAQYNFATINELWLRQIVPSQLSQPCFNGNPTVCQLADMAAKIGSLDSILIVLVGVALIPTFLNLLLSRHFTRPRALIQPKAG